MKRFLGSLALSAFLLAPVNMLVADDHPEHHDRQHAWNDGENTYWHQYLKEHHRKDHDWEKASKKEQEAYWKWRDQHRDAH